MADRKLGVILLNMGGPDSTADVPPYLLNIFRDPAILDMPLGVLVRPWLSKIIVKRRAAASAARYDQIGGRTPLNEIAGRQAAVLHGLLEKRGVEAVVAPGMRYWHPFIEEAVRRLTAARVTRAVALSMYPHYSRATTGSCMAALQQALRAHLPGVPLGTVTEWPQLPQYAAFLARQTLCALHALPESEWGRTAVLFSAHSLPAKLIARGDPYRTQVLETFRLVGAGLPPAMRFALGWQSAFGPARWLEPDSKTVVAGMAADGVKNLIVVPLGFVAENIETLWDIEIDLRSWANGHGIHNFTRVPCPNDDSDVMDGLAERILEAAGGVPA